MLKKLEKLSPVSFRRNKKYVELDIKAEEVDFLRAEVFIDDINQLTDGQFNRFSIEDLVLLLYMDFLAQIRDNIDTLNIGQTLQVKYTEYYPAQKQYRALQEQETSFSTRKRWMKLNIRIKRSAALRGEVFIHDVRLLLPGFILTLDDILSVLYIDFIHELRKGNQRKVIEMILQRLEQN